MRTYSGAKNDCELPVSQTLLAEDAPDLTRGVVSADALHAQKKRHSSFLNKGRTTLLA